MSPAAILAILYGAVLVFALGILVGAVNAERRLRKSGNWR